MIRELKDNEHVKMTDKREDGLGIYLTEVGKTAGSFDQSIYRTEVEPATFEESANFDVVARQEPVDKVIHPKADISAGDIHGDDPIFNIVLKKAINPANAMNITNMLRGAGVTHPKDNERQEAIDHALDFFSMMDAPSPEQLGVLYDAGYLLPK